MSKEEIHKIFLKAAIESARSGASAKEIADYLEDAAKGMKINAAFALKGAELISVLEDEVM